MTRGRAGVVLLALAACGGGTVAGAEARGDVPWLEHNGSADAVAALGRLADRNPKALAALDVRSAYDPAPFRAAWVATLRSAPWGAQMLRAGLADPKTADAAASGMGPGDPNLVPFVDALESALVRLSASSHNQHIAAALASVGPEARATIERRLVDASTRGAMCGGIASRNAAPDARDALFSAPVAARDAPGCVEAVVRLAADDDRALDWVAEQAEPGILGAASKSAELPCARLHTAWVKALATRPASLYDALTVPLSYAITRCAAETDGILADAIIRMPASHRLVVEAIDPFARYEDGLHATCAALPVVVKGADAAVLRERASDALNHICSVPK